MVHVSWDTERVGFVGQLYPTFNALVSRNEKSPRGTVSSSFGGFFFAHYIVKNKLASLKTLQMAKTFFQVLPLIYFSVLSVC